MLNKLKEILNKINKKTKIIILVALLAVILTITIVLLTKNNVLTGFIKKTDSAEIKNEFEKLNNELSEDGKEYPEVKLPSDNSLKYATIDDVLNILNTGGDEVIYFGYPTCIYCRNAIQVLVDTAKETSLDVIYYLELEETDDKYNELVEALGDELTVEEDGKKKVYLPLVIFITDGKIISYNKGTLFSQEDPYQKLDDSQVNGLSEIYRYGINDVISSKNLKKDKKL